MTTLEPGFWSGWVIGITVISLLGLLWLLKSVYTAPPEEAKPTDTVWDDSLREGSAHLPKWWFFMCFSLLIYTAAYLFLYPGLGHFPGVLSWSQHSQFDSGMVLFREKTEETRRHWETAPYAELRADASAMASARRLFANQCAACHGKEGLGQANRFPNLSDDAWQWGGAEEQILLSIRDGRVAAMPGWRTLLGEQGVDAVTDYVLSLGAHGGEESESHETGKALFSTHCASCHGTDGRGNQALGASNLRDEVWLYGGNQAAVRASIADGRNGVMPAQKRRLEKAQIRLLVSWLTRDDLSQ